MIETLKRLTRPSRKKLRRVRQQLRRLPYYYDQLRRQWLYRRFVRTGRQRVGNRRIETVAVVYNVPVESRKNGIWRDGFVAALDILRDDYAVDTFNLAEGQVSTDRLNGYDFVLVKCNWNAPCDRYIRIENGRHIKTAVGLLISGVPPPPRLRDQLFYDVLWHQTHWYRPQVALHPRLYQAFGIDTTCMQPLSLEKQYDILSIGGLLHHKRYERLKDYPGTKLVVGDMSYPESADIARDLNDAGISVRDYVPYAELHELICRSRKVVITAGVKGGGERAVLEARACGIPVEIADDNPKLEELLTSPIWDQNHYAAQLKKGIAALRGS